MHMLKTPLYNQQGDKISEVELPMHIFGVQPKGAVVHQVVTALQANQRKNLAHTKTRAEVRGGGRKPWRQKGTGRARHGSIRSPLWRGGGVTFGPRNTRNFSQKINQKMKQRAFCMTLSAKVAHERLSVLDALVLPQPKTKELAGLLVSFYRRIDPERDTKKRIVPKTLVVVAAPGMAIRAGRNLPRVTIRTAHSLGLLDVISHERVMIEKGALVALQTRIAH